MSIVTVNDNLLHQISEHSEFGLKKMTVQEDADVRINHLSIHFRVARVNGKFIVHETRYTQLSVRLSTRPDILGRDL